MAEQLELLPSLDIEQVNQLLAQPSPDNRATTARMVGRLLENSDLSETERKLALEIIQVMARDVSNKVRAAVVDSMKSSPLLPPKVAKQLAEDIDSIAVPLLKATDVLSEDDLIELVRRGNLAKQVAIAERRHVGARLSEALADTGEEQVVVTLLENPGAEITEPSLVKILEAFPSDPRVQEAMVQRIYLPLTVVDRLVRQVSDRLREELVQNLRLPEELVRQFVEQGRERTLITHSKAERRSDEVELLVWRLAESDGLTPTLVLRTLLEGDLHFFEAAMAQLAGLTLRNVRVLLYHSDRAALRRLYKQTKLPERLFQAFQIGIEEIATLRAKQACKGGTTRQSELTARIIERLVLAYREIYPAEVDSVLSQIARYLDGKESRSESLLRERQSTPIAPRRVRAARRSSG